MYLCSLVDVQNLGDVSFSLWYPLVPLRLEWPWCEQKGRATRTVAVLIAANLVNLDGSWSDD